MRGLLLLSGLFVLAACLSSPRPLAGTPTATATEAASLSAKPALTAPTVAEPFSRQVIADVPGDAPEGHFVDLVRRYKGISASRLSLSSLYRDDPLGNEVHFSLVDPQTNTFYKEPATLSHVGERALWYVADNIGFSERELSRTASLLDEVVFPGVFDVFAPGKEPPGKITIVIAGLRGVGGYFTVMDAYPQSLYPHSNERLSIYITDMPLASDQFIATLAHELQHFAQWLVDSTESTWVNEGLAEVASDIVVPHLSLSHQYLTTPEVSVVNWPTDPLQAGLNYASTGMFFRYLAQRTGRENLSQLVAEPSDSTSGVKAYLARVAPNLSLEELFAEWVAMNVVGMDQGSDSIQRLYQQKTVRTPGETKGKVAQFGAWYLRVEPDVPLSVKFVGSPSTPLIGSPAHSGNYCWWGNAGDSINSHLTRSLDLRGVLTASLLFHSWYEIEEGWDYAYVSVSTDGGHRWEALPLGIPEIDPAGLAVGPAFTGQSNGWVETSINLTPFAGNKILIRFEYFTDKSMHGSGWCIDDIKVPELGFSDDVEVFDNLWAAEGFFRAPGWGVPQTFLVQVISSQGYEPTIERIKVEAGEQAFFNIRAPATIAVSGLASKSRQPAEFVIGFDAASIVGP